MRITNRMMVENSLRYINDNQEAIYKLEQQIATGKKIQYASDDPATAVTSMSLRSSLNMSNAYLNTMYTTNDWMSATEKAMKDITELATRALTLAQSSISDTQGADERAITGREMESIILQAVEIGNTNHLGNYIFSGFQVNTVPFTYTPPATPPALGTVTYNGDTSDIVRTISPGHNITTNINGNTTFTPLIQAIDSIRLALETNDTTALQTAVNTQLQPAIDNLILTRTTTGARQRDLQTIISRTEKTQTQIKALLSTREDIKAAEAISELQLWKTSYQVVLEVNSQALSALNLFDYLD
jgi:flagellar hook-associated protein 3 FlgL